MANTQSTDEIARRLDRVEQENRRQWQTMSEGHRKVAERLSTLEHTASRFERALEGMAGGPFSMHYNGNAREDHRLSAIWGVIQFIGWCIVTGLMAGGVVVAFLSYISSAEAATLQGGDAFSGAWSAIADAVVSMLTFSVVVGMLATVFLTHWSKMGAALLFPDIAQHEIAWRLLSCSAFAVIGVVCGAVVWIASPEGAWVVVAVPTLSAAVWAAIITMAPKRLADRLRTRTDKILRGDE